MPNVVAIAACCLPDKIINVQPEVSMTYMGDEQTLTPHFYQLPYTIQKTFDVVSALSLCYSS